MSEEISKLLYANRIAKTSKISYVVNPLSPPAQKDKKRFILNIPHINKHIFKENIRIDDWKGMLEYLQTQDYFFKT